MKSDEFNVFGWTAFNGLIVGVVLWRILPVMRPLAIPLLLTGIANLLLRHAMRLVARDDVDANSATLWGSLLIAGYALRYAENITREIDEARMVPALRMAIALAPKMLGAGLLFVGIRHRLIVSKFVASLWSGSAGDLVKLFFAAPAKKADPAAKPAMSYAQSMELVSVSPELLGRVVQHQIDTMAVVALQDNMTLAPESNAEIASVVACDIDFTHANVVPMDHVKLTGVTLDVVTSPGCEWSLVRAAISVPAKLIDVVSMLVDDSIRLKYDDVLSRTELIEDLGERVKLTRAVYKEIWPAKGRDFITLTAWSVQPSGVCIISSRSVNDIHFPQAEECQRTHLYLGGFTASQESDTTCRLTMIAHYDVNGIGPAWLVNWVSTVAIPSMLHNVRDLLLEHRCGPDFRAQFRRACKECGREDMCPTVDGEGEAEFDHHPATASPTNNGDDFSRPHVTPPNRRPSRPSSRSSLG